MGFNKLFNSKSEFDWEEFLSIKTINIDQVREVILNSWQRCSKYNVNFLSGKGNYCSKEEVESRKSKEQELIKAAEPFMREIADFVEDSGFVVVLTDQEGFVLKVVGDKETLNKAKDLKFVQGAFWSEDKVGTNAIGTVLEVNQPLQIVGEEHFCKEHHSWTCSAAPIHNNSGEIIGVLDMSGLCDLAHSHTLGIVVSAVKAIEKHLLLNQQNTKLQMANNFSQTVLNSISEGLISINQAGYITKINNAGLKMLEANKNEIVGEKIEEVLGSKLGFDEVLQEGESYVDEEIFIYKNNKRINMTVTLEPLFNQAEGILGAVITLKKMKAVQKLVNRMVGSQAKFNFEDIIGQSAKLKEAKRLAKLASEKFSNILILGDSGTGKELFAQSIHNYSNYSAGPFVSLNCAAIPKSLLESELFGYKSGTFTGAKKNGRPGKFELANSGTLFLDEIGEMSLNMQSSLLRVLEEREVVRIGGAKAIPIDVQVVAATNKDLSLEVKKGNFRKDLFFRLDKFTIDLPPLRERKDDLLLLVDHFLDKLNSNLDRNCISEQVLNRLLDYHWPGNIRELQSVIDRAVALAEESGRITVQHLPNKLINSTNKNTTQEIKLPVMSLAKTEKLMIKQAVEKAEGNISQAAELLKIGRSTLYRKLKKYDLK